MCKVRKLMWSPCSMYPSLYLGWEVYLGLVSVDRKKVDTWRRQGDRGREGSGPFPRGRTERDKAH